MKKMNFMLGLILIFFASFLHGLDSPEKFLGFKPGTDRKLAHYNQIKDFFIKTGKESPRIITRLIGKTTLNNDMIMAIISSKSNLKQLAFFREISRKLSMGEPKMDKALNLANKGKPIVFINCNLHASEIGSSQMAMQLLYQMATNNSPKILKILNNIIFVLIPSANPDGQMMIVDWYNKNKGTDYEGGSLPYLYHWYAGHDNNRDWYKINLKETWLITRELYFNWFPQVLVDEHQMGKSGDRFFVPPFADPPTPGIHPLVWRANNLLGAKIAYDLEKLNYQGVASRGFFMGWWIGAVDDTAWFHNIPGLLFEAASVRIASPIYIEPEEVKSSTNKNNEERMFSPSPWNGGWWRLMDIVNYDLYATLSVLDTVATSPDEFLMNSYKMATDNIQRGKKEKPFAYIVPKNQWDPGAAKNLIKTLCKSNIRVYQLTSPHQTHQYYFQKGSYVIPMAQPYRSFISNIFGIQHYPDLRNYSTDQFISPYDGAGWTLSIGMGVNTIKIKNPFTAKMKIINLNNVYQNQLPGKLNKYLILKAKYNNSYLAASILLKKGINIWRDVNGNYGEKGDFFVRKSEALDTLNDVNKNSPLTITSESNISLDKLKKLKPFKVGLYQNWGHNMEEGWTRFVLDEFKLEYDTIHPKDFLKEEFIKKYDILLFVNSSKSEIESGEPHKEDKKWYTPFPPEYRIGIGEKGKTLLKKFLKQGKTIVFIDRSCEYALSNFNLPVKNILKENESVICPGSYLEINVKESDLTYGMPPKAAIYYNENPAFKTKLPQNSTQRRNTPITFGTRDLLLSGYLKGEEHLIRKSLMVDLFTDGGRIILIGPDIVFRGQSEGTYKILFNILFTASHESSN